LDYIQWLLGEPEEVSCFASRLGDWDTDDDVEDIATMMLRYPSGALAGLHLNHFQRNYTHDLELVGRDGTIVWSYSDGNVALYQARKSEWDTHTFELERDDMYRAQAESFAHAVQRTQPPRVTGEDGVRALRLGLAALQSARTRTIVRLKNEDNA
ncbi:MAG TPA: Gfo/Idh/MocA family oxidoreductase, partial [Armatimonadota bacterium]|nr:Gfo/Idh/MocA family oxidoreductase [Armatimonadota bacterium]